MFCLQNKILTPRTPRGRVTTEALPLPQSIIPGGNDELRMSVAGQNCLPANHALKICGVMMRACVQAFANGPFAGNSIRRVADNAHVNMHSGSVATKISAKYA